MGRVRACPHRRRGSLTVPLELGSRESVKLHHFGKRTEIAALWGGFFSGGAQRQPAVFLGGMRFGAPASWRTFLFLVCVADTLRVMVKSHEILLPHLENVKQGFGFRSLRRKIEVDTINQ